MPIFEFECKKCKKVFEVLVRSAKDKAVCPHCGAKDPSKLVSSFSAPDSGTKDCPSGGPCDSPAQHHCCGGSCGCGGH